MAKIILKWRYLKPGTRNHNQNLVKYIAKRDGVEKIDDSWKSLPVSVQQKKMIEQLLKDFPDTADSYEYQDYLHGPTQGNASEFITHSIEENVDRVDTRENYVQYIANRPRVQRFGSHGLFTDADVPINLKQVAKEVADYDGILMTQILSLRREDAARLGFEKGEVWRDMLREQADELAKAMGIPIEDLRWYAAFHNEGHHPHCHIISYSVGKEPYMTKQGLLNLKSAFARAIFHRDLIQIYDTQTRYRNEFNADVKTLVTQIVADLNENPYRDDTVALMLRQLAARLQATKGKKVYGYLPATARNLVNAIMDELMKDERLGRLYALWYDQRDLVVQIYQESAEKRVPLSQNKTFHAIKNIIIREALNISPDAPLISAEEIAAQENQAPIFPKVIPDAGDELPVVLPLEEIDMTENIPEVESQNHRTDENDPSPMKKSGSWWSEQYQAARESLYGTKERQPDHAEALLLMTREAEAGNGLAMYDLGKMYLSGLGGCMDEAMAQHWFSRAYNAFLQMEQTDKKKDYWQYRIGKLYALGHGIEQNYKQSAEWFAKAMASGNSLAAYSLGEQYYRGQGVEKDDTHAFKLFTIAAADEKRPNAYAQYQLGKMYAAGCGTAVDAVAAQKWNALAYQGFLRIEQTMSDDRLYYRLGSMNLTGTGTDVNLNLAAEYLAKAVNLGNADAMYGLGKLLLRTDYPDRNPPKAIDYLTQAAEKEHDYAQYLLGKTYLQGKETPQNTSEGVLWLERSAEHGNQYAQYLLGKTLLQGELIEPNSEKALELLECAIAQKNPYAAFFLGREMLSGERIPVDVKRAEELLTAAANGTFTSAQYTLGKLYLIGDALLQDIKRALYWLWKAANQGDSYALYQLGKMYLFGQNVDRDEELGKKLLSASAEQGNIYAQRILESYGKQPICAICIRLASNLAQTFQESIEKDHRNVSEIDRKLRRKIAEKKQAHGQRIG